jgi:RsiW-degrading membrane proteinase PrsW (M82 family)
MVLTLAATERFCQIRIKRGKAVTYWMVLVGASVVPILTTIFETCSEPDIWWSHAGKGSPEDFLINLGLLGVLCALPAALVVLRFKRQSK